jgi:hypothetical protein
MRVLIEASMFKKIHMLIIIEGCIATPLNVNGLDCKPVSLSLTICDELRLLLNSLRVHETIYTSRLMSNIIILTMLSQND